MFSTLYGKLPPGGVVKINIPTAPKIEWDVGEGGDQECRPEIQVLAKYAPFEVRLSNPTPKLE